MSYPTHVALHEPSGATILRRRHLLLLLAPMRQCQITACTACTTQFHFANPFYVLQSPAVRCLITVKACSTNTSKLYKLCTVGSGCVIFCALLGSAVPALHAHRRWSAALLHCQQWQCGIDIRHWRYNDYRTYVMLAAVGWSLRGLARAATSGVKRCASSLPGSEHYKCRIQLVRHLAMHPRCCMVAAGAVGAVGTAVGAPWPSCSACCPACCSACCSASAFLRSGRWHLAATTCQLAPTAVRG